MLSKYPPTLAVLLQNYHYSRLILIIIFALPLERFFLVLYFQSQQLCPNLLVHLHLYEEQSHPVDCDCCGCCVNKNKTIKWEKGHTASMRAVFLSG